MATATSTALSVQPPGGTLNTVLTLTATVTAVDGTNPTGSVQFKDGSMPVGTVQLDGFGDPAQLFLTPARGMHSYTASFQPATNVYAASVSSSVSVFISAGFNAGRIITNAQNPTQIFAARPGRDLCLFWTLDGATAIINSDRLSTEIDGALVTSVPLSVPGYDGEMWAILPGPAHGYGLGTRPTTLYFLEVFG